VSQVVKRAAAILRALEEHPQGRSVAETAGAVGLPRSSVHRLLKALEDEHLVAGVSEEGGFRLGPALMHLASSANSWLVETVHPFLEELSRSLDETVDLAVQSGATVYFIDQVAAAHRLQAVSHTGLAFPAHCSANGKALLAELPDDRVAALVDGTLSALTPNTITDMTALLKELAEVRESGVAFDREEHHLGISAVGTTLHNPYGLEVAVSVPVPSSRFVDREDEIVEQVLKGRQRIEEHFGLV